MSTFIAQHVSRSYAIELPVTPFNVFHLFEPLGEKNWAAGWDPEMLYPSSGEAAVGTVFATHHADEPTRVWTVLTYEREQGHISYFNVLPSSHTSWIDIVCESTEPQASRVQITYTLTALTAQGNTYIDTFTQEHYQTWIASWQKSISHYLLHGHMLPHKH